MSTAPAGASAQQGALTSTEQWDRATDWPMMAAALAFLEAYAIPILRPDLSAGAQFACQSIVWATRALFVVDYVARLVLAEHRGRYFVRHLLAR
jgi:voltage-gated potassium channel